MDNLESVRKKFDSIEISTDVLLPNIKVANLESKQSPAFHDSRYLPFYYRLGCELQSNHVIQIGANLGLVGACFLKGRKSVKKWTIYEHQNSNQRIVESNLKLCGCENISFLAFDSSNEHNSNKYSLIADLAFLTERFDVQKTLIYLNFLWNELKNDGFLVVDFIADEQVSASFYNFCSIKNREPTLFNTRYKVGVLKK